MAHGMSENKNAYFVSIRGIKKDSPEDIYFFLKKGDVEEQSNFIEGYLTKAEADEYEYEGRPKKAFKLHLKDGETNYILSSGMTGVGRSLLNSLASLEDYSKKIKINVWTKRSDDKVYQNIGIIYNGERGSWKYTWAEQSKLIKKRTDADTGEFLGNNYTALNDLFVKEVLAIDKKIVEGNDMPFDDDDDLDTIMEKCDDIEAKK